MTPKEEYELGLSFYNGDGKEKNIDEAIKHFKIAAKAGNLEAMNNLGVVYSKEEQYRNLELAIEWLTKASKLGNAQSTLNLGKLSYYKDYGQVDNKKALGYFKQATEQGSIDAALLLGDAYYFGERVERDYTKAIEYLSIAANGGNRDAYSLLGESYFYGNGVSQDYGKSFQYYLLASNEGIALDSFNVAFMLEYGKGVDVDLDGALKYYKIAANGDYAPAMYAIGRFYFEGIGVNVDYGEAFKWYLKAAEKKYEHSYLCVGYLYQEGLGIDKDYDAAFKYYTLGAETRDVGCINNLGRCYEEGWGCQKNLEEAFRLYKEAADGGDVVACFNLGINYELGISVPIDYEKAREYYERAAEAGDSDACTNLGLLYEIGRGVEKNREQSKYWFIKAAEAGDSSGYFGVGRLYHYGIGGNVDFGEAIKWYKKASELNYGPALNNLGTMYELGNGVEVDYQMAVSCYQSAAQLNGDGAGMAEDNLACMYYSGKGVPRDYEKAAYWFKLAAKSGIRNSQYYLGMMYATGRGVEQDYSEAFKFFRLAANRGHVFSQIHLGNAFCSGQGVEINYQQAVFWWRKAAKMGYRGAMYNLGCAYAKGLGVPQSIVIAKDWWSRAAQLEDYASKNALANPLSNENSFRLDRFSDTEIFALEEKAKSGDVPAQICLGDIYYRGKDRSESKNQSAFWYTKASEAGNAEAKFKLASLYLHGFNPSTVLIRNPKELINEASVIGYGRAQRINRVIDFEAQRKHILNDDEIKALCDNPYSIDEIVYSIYGDIISNEDLLRLLFVLYLRHRKYSLTFEKNDVIKKSDEWDDLARKLYERIVSPVSVLSMKNESELYKQLGFISDNEYEEDYPDAIREIVCRRVDLIDNPIACPPISILESVATVLNQERANSIFHPEAGVGILSYYLPDGAHIFAHTKCPDDALVARIVADAADVEMRVSSSSKNDLLTEGYDTQVCFTRLRDVPYAEFDINGTQDRLVKDALSSPHNIGRLNIILVDQNFCTSIGTESEDIRKSLIEGFEGHCLERIIKYPKGTFSDIKETTSLLIIKRIDGKAPCNVVFEHDGIQTVVNTKTIAEMNYSFNPDVYLQSVTQLDGQIVVKLKDILDISISGDQNVQSFILVDGMSFSHSLLRVLGDEDSRSISNRGADTFWLKYRGPVLYLRVNDGIELHLVKTDDYSSSRGVGYALKAKESMISIEYLAYILLNDKGLQRRINGMSDDSGKFSIADFLNIDIAIYANKNVQHQIVEEAMTTERQASKTHSEYGVALISSQAGDLIDGYGSIFDVSRLSINHKALRMSGSGDDTYRYLYDHFLRQKDCSINAILLDTRTTDYEDVLSDFKELTENDIHIYLLYQGDTQSLGLRNREKEYFIGGNRVFEVTDSDIHRLCNKVRDDLDKENSPITRIRNQYKNVFDAADAIDKKYNLTITEDISGFILDGCKIEDNPASGSCGPFRLIGHDLINVMKAKRIVPLLDPGAIPHLLADKYYYDTSTGKRYYQYEPIMPRYLADALCYFISATNSGVHGSQDSSLIGRSALNILMEFILWFYKEFIVEAKYDYIIPDKYFWGVKDDYVSVRRDRDYVVSCIDDGKEKYFFCENIHLKTTEGLHAGSKVRFTTDRLGDDNKPRFDNGLRVVFYANEKQFYIVTE